MMSIMPSQKAGMAVASMAKIMLMLSRMEYRFTADRMPMGMPISTDRNIPARASSAVLGNRSAMVSATGMLVA